MVLKRLGSYLARDRRQHLALGQQLPDRMTGSALLADISGFTPLTEALAEQLGSRRGAEELTVLLNAVYTDLVSRIHHFNGSVVCFIGDALIASFPNDDGMRSLACGLQMQRVMRQYCALPLPQGGRVNLAMKAAVAVGPLRRFLVGDPQIRSIDVLAGRTVDRLSDAEHVAMAGDLVASPEVTAALGPRLWIDAWRGQIGVVAGLRENAGALTTPDRKDAAGLTAAVLRPYLLEPVYQRVAAGHGDFLSELRPVAAIFLRFDGIEYDEDDDAGSKLHAYTSWVQAEVARYGGHVLLLTTADKGSHLYAVFGALEAHEDDAKRAIAASEALLRIPQDLAFIKDLRIGVSYGRARVGAYGGITRRTYGALGDVVNLAARLMGIAPSGEIRCSESLVSQVRGGWAFEPLEAVQLKGMTRQQRVYRPTGPSVADSPSESVLVGRERELDQLADALKAAKAGSRQIRIIEGEAGIGKSRLINELTQLARSDGFVCLIGEGDSIEQHTPYRAWRDPLAAFLGFDPSASPDARRAAALARLHSLDRDGDEHAPLLNDILGLDLPESKLTRGLTPEIRQESLGAWLGSLLERQVRDRPLLLILDDVHWLDSLSWDLAVSIARTLAQSPILIVLTHRPFGELEPAGLSTFAGLSGAHRLPLGGLPPEAMRHLAATHLGLPPSALPDVVGDLIEDRAEGNPFYAREIVSALLDTGRLRVEEGSCVISVDSQALREEVPGTLEGVVLSRIDRLPNEEQLTVKVASVVGRSFLVRILEHIYPAPVDPHALRNHLDHTTQRLLTILEAADPELIYAFQHHVTQQVTYDMLLFEQRRALHRSVAGWYEQAFAENLSPHYPLLAFHWNRAGQLEFECRYCLLAGEQAAGQYANAEAEVYLSRALELLDNLGEPATSQRRYDVLRQRVAVNAILGHVDEERVDLHALMKLAESSMDVGQRGQVLVAWSDFHNRCGQFDEALARGEAALAALQQTADPKGEARALMQISKTFEQQGDFESARTKSELALDLFREAGDESGEADSLKSLGIIRARLGKLLPALEQFKAAREVYRRIGDRKGEADILGNLGALSYYLGDYEATIQHTEQAQPMFEDMGNRGGSARCLSNLGNSYNALGAFEKGLAYHERSATLYQQLEDSSGYADSLTNMGTACHALGVGGYPELTCGLHPENDRLCEAIDHHRMALEIAHRIGSKPGEVLSHFNLGSVHLCLGRTDVAEDHLRRAMALGQELGLEGMALRALAALARASLQRSDPDLALTQSSKAVAHLEEEALPFADEIHFTQYQVLQSLGREAEAGEHLRHAADAILAQAATIQEPALRASYRAMHHEVLSALSQAEAASPQGDAA